MGFAEGALALGGLAGEASPVGVFARRLRLNRARCSYWWRPLGLLPIAVVLGVPMDAMLAYGIVVAGLFASMACATMFSIQAISFMQLRAPGHLVGKVIALTMSLANCAQPVGQLIYGGLFDALRGGTSCRWRWARRPSHSSSVWFTFRVLRKLGRAARQPCRGPQMRGENPDFWQFSTGFCRLFLNSLLYAETELFAWMYRVWLGGAGRGKARRARAFSMTESRRFLPEFPVSLCAAWFRGVLSGSCAAGSSIGGIRDPQEARACGMRGRGPSRL